MSYVAITIRSNTSITYSARCKNTVNTVVTIVLEYVTIVL
jgi:hypothetical protein